MAKKILIPFILIGLFSVKATAQVENLRNTCALNFPPEYVSDGQEYFASLKPDQVIEFRTTFFGENTYRITTCTSVKKGQVVLTVYDTDKNLLFSNRDYDYSPYWNFRFTSTVTCIIQVDVVSQQFTPGYVMLLIGFKQ
ncbi:MAG TPA: hypothetical protein PKO42_05140 [Tenuifilaceae bacterium]|jgi:hypothetical protein|nr:hypothetical protein [Bacteroidales bacterium]HNY09253.1 hypothetical protein [Tenuifilaceae bacterium]MBP8643452.1 hypothetical protein [Bacteroidales bacterium]NLI87496.1 hypothetical protein [Bacteroidales bacterium]HPA67317.1 hypothetical protein [Tenuifilaceae bacterium]